MEPILPIERLYLMNCAGLMFKTRPTEVILVQHLYILIIENRMRHVIITDRSE